MLDIIYFYINTVNKKWFDLGQNQINTLCGAEEVHNNLLYLESDETLAIYMFK
jgi:hypothetical protein